MGIYTVLIFILGVTAHNKTQSWYSKTCVKRPPSERQKIGFQYQLSLNAGQMYCRMLQREHSAILSTFIKLPFVIKVFVLSIFEWPFYTGFTVLFYGICQQLRLSLAKAFTASTM